MFAIILVQAFRSHMPVVQGQRRQQVERAMPVVFKLLSLNLTGPHQLDRSSLQYLQIGLFIHGDDHFTPPPQAVNSLVIPENSERARDGFLIPDGGLPSARAMGLNVSRAQEIAHSGGMYAFNNFLVHGRSGQTAQRPMCDRPTHRSRRTPSQAFNRLPLAFGNKQADDQSAVRRISRRLSRPGDSVHTLARWWPYPVQRFRPKISPVAGRRLGATRFEPVGQPATGCAHPAATVARRLCPCVSTRTDPACDRAWLISRSWVMANATIAASARQAIHCRT